MNKYILLNRPAHSIIPGFFFIHENIKENERNTNNYTTRTTHNVSVLILERIGDQLILNCDRTICKNYNKSNKVD